MHSTSANAQYFDIFSTLNHTRSHDKSTIPPPCPRGIAIMKERPLIVLCVMTLTICTIVFLGVKLSEFDRVGQENVAQITDRNSGHRSETESGEVIAAVEAEIRFIMSMPGVSTRRNLFSGWLRELKAEEFAAAYEAWGRSEARQVRNDRGELGEFLEFWAKADAFGAWETVRPMFRIASGSHFNDSWSDNVQIPRDRKSLPEVAIWPGTRDLHGFLFGLEEADISHQDRLRLRDAYVANWEMTDTGSANEIPKEKRQQEFPTSLELYSEVTEFANGGPVAELSSRIEDALVFEEKRPIAIELALQRWIKARPEAAPEALELVQPFGHEYESMVMREWARLAPDAMWHWVEANQPGEFPNIPGYMLMPWVSDDKRRRLLSLASEESTRERLLVGWAANDPQTAFEAALELGGPRTYSGVARSAFYSSLSSSHVREVIAAIKAIRVPIDDEFAYVMMEEWGDFNVVEAAKYGVDWLLRSPGFSREELILRWTGKEDPFDSSVDDRTFGCLRKWAACHPSSLREWARSLKDPQVREALIWMADHPNREN